jgi:hypothetical protein
MRTHAGRLGAVCICLSFCFCQTAHTQTSDLSDEQQRVGKDQRFTLGTKRYSFSTAVKWPEKGVIFRDPTFNSTLVRVTDKARDGYEGKGIRQEYSRSDPESVDGAHLVLRATEANWYLYSARSYKLIRRLPELGSTHEPELRWDPRTPSLLYHLAGLKLQTYDVKSKRNKVVHDFKKEFPSLDYLTTGSEGDASVDRRYWCFALKKDVKGDWLTKAILVYDRQTDSILGSMTKLPHSKIDYVTMDMSGKHCIVAWDDVGTEVYSRDLKRKLKMPAGFVGHSDVAWTADRRDVAVIQNTKTDWISMVDLETGKETNLVSLPFTENTDLGLHFSGNAARTPGWVLVSTYGARNPPKGKRHSWMDHQLFMVELKAAPRIWRIAHNHSNTFVNPDEGEKEYFAEPQATINLAGTRAYFSSNWESFNRIELFSVLLPAGWAATISKPAR